MLIGLGGGAASSQTSAEESAELDFASVQRYVLIEKFATSAPMSKLQHFLLDTLACPYVIDVARVGV